MAINISILYNKDYWGFFLKKKDNELTNIVNAICIEFCNRVSHIVVGTYMLGVFMFSLTILVLAAVLTICTFEPSQQLSYLLCKFTFLTHYNINKIYFTGYFNLILRKNTNYVRPKYNMELLAMSRNRDWRLHAALEGGGRQGGCCWVVRG